MQVALLAVGDAHGAPRKVAAQLGAQFERGPVRRDGDRLAVADAALARVVGVELDLAVRSLELELGRALDGGAAEERAVREETKTGTGYRSGAWYQGLLRRPRVTRFAPPRPMKDVPSTIRMTSDNAGRYAPPATHIPITAEI